MNKWTVVALKDALSEGAPATNGVSRIVAVVERAITWDLSFGTGRRCRMPLEAQFALHHVLWRYGRWIRCRTSPSIAVDLVNKDPEIVRLSGNLGKEVPRCSRVRHHSDDMLHRRVNDGSAMDLYTR